MSEVKRYSCVDCLIDYSQEEQFGPLVLYTDYQAAQAKIKDLENKLNTAETGFGEQHEAYRYRKIHSAVDQMGGFANFSHWVNEHAKNYFNTANILQARIEKLEQANNVMREALEFYSKAHLYQSGGMAENHPVILDDYGDLSREALNQADEILGE